ncbi:cytochrome c [Devosia sp. UYZn731]|uniref:c-type cytochrome n=1 Tax=Devosia sp. UYZn731 TaxID=3156345 RepID=UPI003391CCF4
MRIMSKVAFYGECQSYVSGSMKHARRAVLIAAALAAPVATGGFATAQDTDSVEAGHALVTMYCTDCHATEITGDSPFPTAPRFRDLHLRYDVENLSEALVEGIVTAHDEMPQFEFDPDQAAAIVAYLKSLEP